VARLPALPAIAAVALWLLVLFLSRIWVAAEIFDTTFCGADDGAFGAVLEDHLTTLRGLMPIVLGHLAGLAFAVVTLCASVIALPLLPSRALSALVGLVVVLPVLGHATWHLSRRIVPDVRLREISGTLE
jgi:uncharacterized membrane protein